MIFLSCVSNLTFWERNQGDIIGTLGAGIIAIFAAFLTYYIQRQQLKYAYQGFLYVLYIELINHNNNFKLLKDTLAKAKLISIEKRDFIFEKAPMQFSLLIIENTLSKATNYKKFNHKLIALLTSYADNIRNINYFLDFTNAKEIITHQEQGQNIEHQIADYFETLNIEYIEKTQPVIKDLLKQISVELKNYKNKYQNF